MSRVGPVNVTTQKIIPAIMSGGAGTRLWPLSTEARPKQFHALGGARTMIQETVLRTRGAHDGISFADPIILCNLRHGALVEAQLAEIGVTPAAIVLEPVGRNTAATAALAGAVAEEIDQDALVLLAPADQIIADAPAFLAAIARAAPIARERIVTFGIAPTRAETGYGYIKSGAALGDGVHAIESFREKPDAATAESYLASGDYSWNAGIFLFAPRVLAEEFAHSAAIRDAALAALGEAKRNGVSIALAEHLFAAAPAVPLDIAVMEKTARGAVARCDIGWADIGSWSEIWRLSPKDENGNVIVGDAITRHAQGNLIRSDGPRVVVSGVSDLVVVVSGDTIMILPRERAQEVKDLQALARKED